jgi:signal transduction histidine kinase
MRIMQWLEKRSRASLLIIASLLVLAFGALDYLTGSEISFSIFYLIPTALIAWLLGTVPGLALSISSALVWLLADLLAGHIYSSPSIPYWNAAVRLGLFTLRAAQRRQDEMLHFLVHDLRAPLSNITTGLQVLQEIRDPSLEDASAELIETCLVSCSRMFLLINTLLDLGRLQSGRMPVQLAICNMEEIISAAIEEVKLWAKRNDVALESHVGNDALTFFGDPVLTTRVLVNLLGNAIKNSPNGASIRINAAQTPSHKLKISVEDQGSGISKEFISSMFTKYAQSNLTMGKAIGTGIGLSFIREAVDAQSGRVYLERSSSDGTTISFELPAVDESDKNR